MEHHWGLLKMIFVVVSTDWKLRRLFQVRCICSLDCEERFASSVRVKSWREHWASFISKLLLLFTIRVATIVIVLFWLPRRLVKGQFSSWRRSVPILISINFIPSRGNPFRFKWAGCVSLCVSLVELKGVWRRFLGLVDDLSRVAQVHNLISTIVEVYRGGDWGVIIAGVIVWLRMTRRIFSLYKAADLSRLFLDVALV